MCCPRGRLAVARLASSDPFGSRRLPGDREPGGVQSGYRVGDGHGMLLDSAELGGA